MRLRSLICGLLFLVAPLRLFAASVEFTPTLHVYDCPPGFKYEVLECEDHVTQILRVHIELTKIDEGWFIGDWAGEANGLLHSYNRIAFTLYPNEAGVTHLMIHLSSGFEADTVRNPSSFFEAKPDRLPEWFLLTGEKRRVGNREAEATLEYADLVFQP